MFKTVMFWIFLALATGFIGYFGKHMAKKVLGVKKKDQDPKIRKKELKAKAKQAKKLKK